MLGSRENKIKPEHDKVLRFGENKIKAELKNVKKQDLNRFEHSKAKMDGKKLKEKKPLMFSENKIKAEMDVMKREEKNTPDETV